MTRCSASNLEQTGIIWAKIDVGGQPVNAFAIWMGLEPEERAQQISAALAFIRRHPGPAVFGGISTLRRFAGLCADRRRRSGRPVRHPGAGLTADRSGDQPNKRIDFAMAARPDAGRRRGVEALASDHRMVVVEVKNP